MKTKTPQRRLPTRVKAHFKELGLLIRGARLNRRWTQKDLAERAGTSVPTIQRLEQGSPAISLATASMVCWLLDLGLFPTIPPGQIEYLKAIANSRQRARLPNRDKPDDEF